MTGETVFVRNFLSFILVTGKAVFDRKFLKGRVDVSIDWVFILKRAKPCLSEILLIYIDYVFTERSIVYIMITNIIYIYLYVYMAYIVIY